MAWSGGDVPGERANAAVEDLVEARDGVLRLKSFLLQLGDHRAPWAEVVVDGVLHRLSNVASALDVAGAAAGRGGQSPVARSDGETRPQPSASSNGNTRKRSFGRRSQRAFDQRITATLDDGHIWRKYGQKEIQDSPYPRSYFRCTHKSDQGCNAKRHVQLCAADPSKHVVTYYGKHTCRDPSKVPPVIHGSASDGGAGNLISFAPSSRANAGTTGGASSQQQQQVASVAQLSTSWCASDDLFSSSAGSFMQVDELGAVVVGSTAGAGVMSTRTLAAGSAPDNGGMMIPGSGGGGTGAGSFPSSPTSLGIEVGNATSIAIVSMLCFYTQFYI